MTPQSYREIDKWKGRDLEPGLQAVTRQADHITSRRLLVYRPYWLARVAMDGEADLVPHRRLLRGDRGSIPTTDEANAMLQLAIRRSADARPGSRTAASRGRLALPGLRVRRSARSRRPRPRVHRTATSRSSRVRRASASGPTRARGSGKPGSTATTSRSGVTSSGWRWRAARRSPGSRTMRALSSPRHCPADSPPAAAHLWVPAVRLLGTEFGDEAFQGLVQWIHEAHSTSRTARSRWAEPARRGRPP